MTREERMRHLAAQMRLRSPPAAPSPAPPPTAAPAPVVEPSLRPGVTPQHSPPPPARAELSEERVRQLYGQYVETKRQQNESTAALTFDGLAKTLRASSAKLKEKHTGKTVDFEVTIKDGKTILRPIVK